MAERTCCICSEPFNAKGPAITCSPRCKRTRKNHMQNAQRQANAVERTCTVCNASFRSQKATAIYCSTNCEGRAKAIRYRRVWPQSKLRYYDCPGGCGRTMAIRWHEPNRRCNSCPPYSRIWFAGACQRCATPFVVEHQPAAYCSDRCANGDAKDRHRAIKRAAFVENVRRTAVFNRDGWRCQLCGKALHRARKVPHPMAPTIDHIVPLAQGGEHSMRNVQAAHFLCNAIKGDRHFGPEQLRLVG